MLKPAHLLSLDKACITRQGLGTLVALMQQHIQKMQADAGHQNGRHRHQGHPLTSTAAMTLEGGANQGAFVLTKSFSTRFRAIGLTFQVSPEK